MDKNKQRSNAYARVSVRAALDKNLHHAPFRVLVLLASYADKNGYCYPSQQTIANIIGVSKQAVNQNIKTLEELGYIQKHRRKRPNGSDTSCGYVVIYNPDSKAELDDVVNSSLPPSQPPELNRVSTSEALPHNIPINKPIEDTDVLITSLEDLEWFRFQQNHKDYFEKQFPDIDIETIRKDVIRYCDDKGKRYPNYWHAMKNFAQRQKKDGKYSKAEEDGKPLPPVEKPKGGWKKILFEKHGVAVYRSWFHNLSWEKDGYVIAPTRFMVDWCRKEYEHGIEAALKQDGKVFNGIKVASPK